MIGYVIALLPCIGKYLQHKHSRLSFLHATSSLVPRAMYPWWSRERQNVKKESSSYGKNIRYLHMKDIGKDIAHKVGQSHNKGKITICRILCA